MEHARKMVLIPQETMDRLEDGKREQPTTAVEADPVGRLDQQMRSILGLVGKSDREKWKLYRQVLQRYLFFTGESRKPLQFNIRDTGGDAASMERGTTESEERGTTESVEVGSSPPVTDDIVVTVPQKYQRKAELLLKHLLENARGGLTWDRQGQVSIEGTPIQGANIIDLINDVVRERKSVQAVGRAPFARLLHAVNTPLEYIGNPAFVRSNPTPRLRPIKKTLVVGGIVRRKKKPTGNTSRDASSSSSSSSSSGSTDSMSTAPETPVRKNTGNKKKSRPQSGTGVGCHWWSLKLK